MKNVIDSQGFGNLKAYRFWPVTISFCKVYVKPQNANWVQDYMAVRSLLPVAHMFSCNVAAVAIQKSTYKTEIHKCVRASQMCK